MKRRWADACPETPERFHDMLVNTLSEVDTMRIRRKGKVSAALVAALIGLLVLSAAALAARHSGLLDRLFDGETPSPQAEALLQQPDETKQQDDVSVTIDEYLYDGETVHMSWTAESKLEQPVFYCTTYPRVNGSQDGGLSSTRVVASETLAMLGRSSDVLDFGRLRQDEFTIELPDALANQTLRLTMTAQFFTAGADLIARGDLNAEYTNADEKYDPSWGLAVDRGLTFAPGCDSELVPAGYVMPYRFEGVDTLGQMVELGLLLPLTEIEIDVPMNPPDAAKTNKGSGDGQTFEFGEYTLVVEKLKFKAASTVCELRLYPKRPFLEDEGEFGEDGWRIVDPLKLYRYRIENHDGQNLFENKVGGWCSGIETDEQGRHYMMWLGDWGPLKTVPDEVVLMPYQADQADRTKRVAVPEEAAVVKLK